MNRLKELRQEKKLSQKELAKKIGVHYRTLQNWENGESQIKPDKAQALADHFGVEVGYLLGYNEGHRRAYEFLGEHPKKGDMGIIDFRELLEAHELGYIKDRKILGELQTDASVAIKFLKSIQSKLLLFGSISKTHTKKLEDITNFLVDFYETVEHRQNTLEQTSNSDD
ncbi:helix-turn-helix domain-containing protein [Streptococcus suis]|uniref:helix-turn-helix transcriptional regulator n=1 Tax=Streptococcus suis TaxID=1307 RepID=UPI00240DB976|nr:helix-turn-helix domain-containing protein [Streptococcus suis]WFA77061.1 helix-turn-helix domain-containing protein [Streptococcus suis]